MNNKPTIQTIQQAQQILETATALGMQIPPPKGTTFYQATVKPDRFEHYITREALIGYYPTLDQALEAVQEYILNQFDIRTGRYMNSPWLTGHNHIREQLYKTRQQPWNPEHLKTLLKPLKEQWLTKHNNIKDRLDSIEPNLYRIIQCEIGSNKTTIIH